MRVQQESPLAVVQAWQDAANRRDINRLVDLSDPAIEIVGPRGSGRGRQVLGDWLGRANVTLTTLRAFVRGDTVVVAQYGVWRSGDTGDVAGEAHIASCFRVAGRRVARIARYEDLDAALAGAGLDYSDERSLDVQEG